MMCVCFVSPTLCLYNSPAPLAIMRSSYFLIPASSSCCSCFPANVSSPPLNPCYFLGSIFQFMCEEPYRKALSCAVTTTCLILNLKHTTKMQWGYQGNLLTHVKRTAPLFLPSLSPSIYLDGPCPHIIWVTLHGEWSLSSHEVGKYPYRELKSTVTQEKQKLSWEFNGELHFYSYLLKRQVGCETGLAKDQ